jgi:hypothetical protein
MNEAKMIAQRYAKFGVTVSMVKAIIRSGVQNGLSRRGATIGARLALSREFHQHECFTAEDIAAVTGETVDEVNQRIEKNKDALMSMGGLVQAKSAPYIKGLPQ